MTTHRAAPYLYVLGLCSVAVFAPIPGLSVVANAVTVLLLGVCVVFMRGQLDRTALALCLLTLPHLVWVGVSYYWAVDRTLAYVALIATVTSVMTSWAALLVTRLLPRSRVIHLGILAMLALHLGFAAVQYVQTPYLRLSGITGNANLLAFILLCLWFIYALLDGVNRVGRQWWVPLTLFGCTLVVILGTACKKALPGFLLLGLALWLRNRRSWRQGLLVLGALGAVGGVALIFGASDLQAQVEELQKLRIVRRFDEFLSGNASDDMRYEMIREASVMFWQRPLTGYGMQSFSVMGAYGTYSHNNYWELLASLGLIGTAAFLLPMLSVPLLTRFNVAALMLLGFLFFWSWGAVVFDVKLYWWLLGTLLGMAPKYALFNTPQARAAPADGRVQGAPQLP